MSEIPRPEFSRLVRLEEISDRDVRRSLEANEAECRVLSARFDLQALDSLTADVVVSRVGTGPLVKVSGTVQAELTQSSVVSLKPVPAQVSEEFSEIFGPEGYRPEFDEEEMPEVFDDGGIDIGEIVAQVLALALDPYPRAPGEAVAAEEVGASVGEGGRRPFAELEELLKKRK